MKRASWLGLAVLAAAAAVWGVSRALVPTAAAARVTRGSVIHVVFGSVTVSAEATSQITSPQDGTVKESNLAIGKEVHGGDVLVKLDPGSLPLKRAQDSDQLADVEKRLADKLPSEILLENMQSDLVKNKALLDKGFYQPAKYADDERAAQAQEITAKTERSGLETQEKNLQDSLRTDDYDLSQYEVDAPYDGTITNVTAHAGDQLAKGAPLAIFISRNLLIEAQVDQDDIAGVQENEEANLQLFAYSGKTFKAIVKRVLPSSDPVTQRFTVILDLVDPAINLVAGLTGEAGFTAGSHDNVLCVPRRALFGNSLLVVSNGRVEIRQVKPGYETLTQAEILANPDPHATVQEGDIVLTENLDLFRTGDRVRTILPASAK